MPNTGRIVSTVPNIILRGSEEANFLHKTAAYPKYVKRNIDIICKVRRFVWDDWTITNEKRKMLHWVHNGE